MMKVQNLSIQGSGIWNEDALIINDQLQIYGVIDGATSLVPFRGSEGETGGRIASQLLKRYFEQISPEEKRNLEQLTREANRILGVEMQAHDIPTDSKDQLWTAGIAVIRITDHYIEYAQSGDCMIMGAYADGSVRMVTRDHVAHIDYESKLIWEQAVLAGVQSKDQLWELVKPRILKNKEKMNTARGYSVLNGRSDAEDFIEYGKINRIQLEELLLHTDGLYYPEKLVNGGRRTSEEILFRNIKSRGLNEYADWLVALEHSDPECITYPRFKLSDDKSAVLIRLG
ncbi:protein phosphatase 2C domain-containing protein [Paenibacillus sp. BR1-192]|uniref:protein phosphatase 2C domain-containing protein n=1 Tax=Paenibacillus sp. BR1-192 TaxID=3032287 RepID=UPI00240DB785|nr:protein phosphatase 2C domain-containing protein [Paenibacillus sp. BR1-192]WFB57959.1 protein phosphatase 2C domain-containing protein [Paenibacillus sp. BR1-192]